MMAMGRAAEATVMVGPSVAADVVPAPMDREFADGVVRSVLGSGGTIGEAVTAAIGEVGWAPVVSAWTELSAGIASANAIVEHCCVIAAVDPEAAQDALNLWIASRDNRIDGNLFAWNATWLRALPKGLVVFGDLIARGSAIEALPDGLDIRGDLDLTGCINISALPEGLKVGGSCSLVGLKNLEVIPEGVRIGESVDLRMCSGLRRLPASMNRVGGYLDINGTAIRTLPDGLHVGEHLYLSASPIERLPKGLFVGLKLMVVGAKAWDGEIPDDAQIGKGISGGDSLQDSVTVAEWRRGKRPRLLVGGS